MSIETQVKRAELYFEEDMPESQAQINLAGYLKGVLLYLYVLENWFVTGNLAIYPPIGVYTFYNIAPDVVLFKGAVLTAAEQTNLSSWMMIEPNRPAPTVVFEISSKETWSNDLDPKPEYYRQLGVKEYFAYDPQHLWQGATTQLRGWHYPDGLMIEMQPDGLGRLWSEELDSWVVPDGAYLRLYDQEGNLRLTGEEAAWQQGAAADQREAQARQQEAQAKQREEVERAAKGVERAAKEAALSQLATERAELEALLEKLRKRNIDPDTL